MSLLTDEIYLSLDRINISLFFWEVKGKMGCIYLILQVLFNSFYGITVGLVILIYILFFASLLTMSILARIEVVLRRAGKSEMHLRYGDIQVDIEKHTALKNGVPVALTPKEFDVLVFFMRNPDVAITREQLLSNIWGFDFTGESRSVDIHVQQVRRKMGLQGKLITIPKLGYRLERR